MSTLYRDALRLVNFGAKMNTPLPPVWLDSDPKARFALVHPLIRSHRENFLRMVRRSKFQHFVLETERQYMQTSADIEVYTTLISTK
jgi:hypothetical protein